MSTPADDGDASASPDADVPKDLPVPPPTEASSAAPPEDELPEWEPLTPELVEDEAIRGDFVIQWAVVGLAILLGCSQIAETKTLIHIRSGEYLATHGILPPKHDYLAFTRVDQPWVNLSWLFDLVAAGVHGLGGGIALTLFQAILAATAFGLLVHTSRSGIRTWWGSICAALALLACFRQFTVQPELITLAGLATLLWLLMRLETGSSTREPWAIVPLVWVWCQLDSRAFLGWGLLLLYAAGEGLGTMLGRPGIVDAQRRRQLWMISALSLIAAAIHPFTWHAWTSPLILYGAEYPGWRMEFAIPTRMELGAWPIWDQRFLITLNHEGVAGLYLMAAALVTMLLNLQRTRWSHVLVWLGINAAAVTASHELAAASIVNCVLATVNAQEWYLARYGQTYSIQWSFLLFSRGGRAVTVVGLFLLAYLIISGRIDGPNGKRTGIGFDEQLHSLMTGYQNAVRDSYDDRPFPFVVRQGDLLIWAGQKSFIDTRLELFSPGGENSLLKLHDKTRRALRRRQADLEGSGDRSHWRKIFSEYDISHVVVRMSGLSVTPNYRTFDDLLRSFDWKLTALNSAVAVFYRSDLTKDQSLKAYLEDHKFDVTEQVFREDVTPVTEPQVWPSTTASYQQVLSLPKRVTPPDIAEANHYLQFATQENPSLKSPQRIAALYQAIRDARAGLRQDPLSAEGYRTLGAAYAVLDQFENYELQQFGVQVPHLLRYYQIVAAYQSALKMQPNDPSLHQELTGLYLRLQKIDLAHRHLQEILRTRPPGTADLPEQVTKQLDEMEKLAAQLENRTNSVLSEIALQLERGENRMNVALVAFQNGSTLAAIETLEEDKISLVQSPQAQVMLSGWLMEAGRVEEADQTLRLLEQQPGIELMPGWRENAIYAAWAQGDYLRVAKLYEAAIAGSEQRRIAAALGSGPLTSSSSPLLPPDTYPWMHVIAFDDLQQRRPHEIGLHLIDLALCRLEQGDLPLAKATLKQALETAPDNIYRPLDVLYWQCLTNEQLDIVPPSEWIPISKDMFAEEG